MEFERPECVLVSAYGLTARCTSSEGKNGASGSWPPAPNVESGQPYDAKRRKPLLAELRKAMKEYLDKMAELRDK